MSYDLNVERLIDATPDEAFDAFLDEAALKEWYQLQPNWTVTVVACDARVGGTTVVEFGDPSVGWRCRELMTYAVLDRPNRIVYTQTFSASHGDETNAYDTEVTVTFTSQDGKTLVTLDETGYPNAQERDDHQNGWPGFLVRLEEVAISRRVVG